MKFIMSVVTSNFENVAEHCRKFQGSRCLSNFSDVRINATLSSTASNTIEISGARTLFLQQVQCYPEDWSHNEMRENLK